MVAVIGRNTVAILNQPKIFKLQAADKFLQQKPYFLTKMGKKDKKAAKKNEKAAAPPLAQIKEETKQGNDTDDVKEVLQLFNKIEELVIDGDPRIKEALSQKPGIQNLLRDDSSLYGLTPRSLMGQQHRADLQRLLFKEDTNTSFQLNNFSPRPQHGQTSVSTQPIARSPRKNIVVPPIAIPENSTLGNTFTNGYHAALIKQHPDGTLESLRVEKPTTTTVTMPAHMLPSKQNTETTIERLQQAARQTQQLPYQHAYQQLPQQAYQPVSQQAYQPVTQQAYQPINQSTYEPVHQYQAVKQPVYQPPKQTAQEVTKNQTELEPQYHSFVYDSGNETTKVQIKLPVDSRTSNKRQTGPSLNNFNEKQQLVPSDVVYQTSQRPKKPADDHITIPVMESFPVPINESTAQYTTQEKDHATAVRSVVINEEGGKLESFGCRLQVPKNAVNKKFLLRLSILGISETPHKTDRIFNQSLSESGTVMMAISPAISVSPMDVEFQKPITIQLPTCIAIHSQSANEEQSAAPNPQGGDIKADDVVIKMRSKNTNNVWVESDTEVFRSSDSIIFNTTQLGDMCAFYKEEVENRKPLNKRLAVFLFKSADNRKKQFVSMLVTEELPHVIQRGIESMPQWLKYTDSCFNIILPEGRNLALYIEAMDRSLCNTDANKIEIPWENIWLPECIIRKHIHVNLLKKDVLTSVQVFIDDGKNKLNAEFVWKTKYQTIHMPDLMTVGDETNQLTEDSLDNQRQLEQDLLKRVSWKPDTPVSKYVTNKELLKYASM